MREAKRAALFFPTIFEGIAQPARADAHMHQVEGANPSALTISVLWCSQSTRLPLMQEITEQSRSGTPISTKAQSSSARKRIS